MLTFTFLGVGRRLVSFFFESSHRVCLIELLLFDDVCATRIKYIVYYAQDSLDDFCHRNCQLDNLYDRNCELYDICNRNCK